jgi:hypothetical protein
MGRPTKKKTGHLSNAKIHPTPNASRGFLLYNIGVPRLETHFAVNKQNQGGKV